MAGRKVGSWETVIKPHHSMDIIKLYGVDDICGPCRHPGDEGRCRDKISHIRGIFSKDQYNRMLDTRIMDTLGLCCEALYTAEECAGGWGENRGL